MSKWDEYGFTNIPVKKNTKEELKKKGKKDESWDTLIRRLTGLSTLQVQVAKK